MNTAVYLSKHRILLRLQVYVDVAKGINASYFIIMSLTHYDMQCNSNMNNQRATIGYCTFTKKIILILLTRIQRCMWWGHASLPRERCTHELTFPHKIVLCLSSTHRDSLSPDQNYSPMWSCIYSYLNNKL